MKRIALGLIAAALIAGCSTTPTWDTTVFPNQVVYEISPPPAVAEAK
jgi:hypothetical protein